MKVAEEIKGAIELDIRPFSDPDKYFEAVFQAKDLDTLAAIVRNNVGEPLKPPGKRAKLPKNVTALVSNIGGLRIEQSFYFKQEENGEYIYVALWPWQSDSSKITVKIGKGRCIICGVYARQWSGLRISAIRKMS